MLKIFQLSSVDWVSIPLPENAFSETFSRVPFSGTFVRRTIMNILYSEYQWHKSSIHVFICKILVWQLTPDSLLENPSLSYSKAVQKILFLIIAKKFKKLLCNGYTRSTARTSDIVALKMNEHACYSCDYISKASQDLVANHNIWLVWITNNMVYLVMPWRLRDETRQEKTDRDKMRIRSRKWRVLTKTFEKSWISPT